MKSISQKIIFFGTEDFSLTVLTGLIEAGYPIAAVITKPDSRSGRGQKYIAPSVKLAASEHNIPVWQPEKLKDITENIEALQPAVGILVSFGKIIPQSTIDLFAPGIINVHPSLLPKYRGPSPIESAIKNGDTKTGVAIMQLSAGMDAGPVYTIKEHALTGQETQPDLYQTLAIVGTDLLLETLPQILNGELLPIPQNDSEATYCQLLTKDEAWLSPKDLTAHAAECRVRAHLNFPKTKLTILGHDIVITKSHVSTEQKTPLDILCQDGAYLSIDELIAPSGRRMDADSFLNGYSD
jgi:methionyl-tRNA formyltransferase